MATTCRDLTTVDLRGLKPHLTRMAATRGLTLSGFIRELLASEVRIPPAELPDPVPSVMPDARVRVSIRMAGVEAAALATAARAAELTLGDYITSCLAKVPAVQGGPTRTEHLQELAASTAEMATVSRSLRHLNELVSDGAFSAAKEYANVVASLDDDVRRHLRLAARTLSDLQPRRLGTRTRHAPVQTARS